MEKKKSFETELQDWEQADQSVATPVIDPSDSVEPNIPDEPTIADIENQID